jgi:hypothetical protein
MTDLPILIARPSLAELLMTVFLRFVALGCLWFALMLWADLIGYGHNGAGRFDILSTDMKTARGALAVLYPVAAVGLWLRGPWGPVIWSAAASLEIVMYQSFPETLGSEPVKIALIASTVVIYLILRVWGLLSRPHKAAAEQG